MFPVVMPQKLANSAGSLAMLLHSEMN